MDFNTKRVRANVTAATTEDLLDRVTVYRDGKELAALEIIGAELLRRGVTPEQIAAHVVARQDVLLADGDIARRCSFCFMPAVHHGWGWRWVRLPWFGKLPLYPWIFSYCEDHCSTVTIPDPANPS